MIPPGKLKRLLFIALLVGFACEDEPEPKDCAGVEGGDNICGCTDSTATNFNLEATFNNGSCCIELWGECYSIENTTYLNLSNSGLTGEIPPEIGNLINLNELFLYNNQLTGEIPNSICDLDLHWYDANHFNISNNQLCPPYPGCVEDAGSQDISNCD